MLLWESSKASACLHVAAGCPPHSPSHSATRPSSSRLIHGSIFFLLTQVRANMTNSNKGEVRAMRWKAHDAAQLVKALRVRKVSI